ncbi:metallopeptidase family protein, partial [Kribbia dieselivorans]|uniref:metallopeptidase family protein n=1 Tax=Kribbia dieselivorans TaxID=331526 RepID=UPI0009F82DC0
MSGLLPSGSSRTQSRQVRRRDRHGRGVRGPLAWPPVPAMVTRREAFDELVIDAATRLQRHLGEPGSVQFAVEDVPPSDPAVWERNVVALSRLFPGGRGVPPRIVVYRRPLEARAADPSDLPHMVHHVLLEQVAALLGVDPDDLEPGTGDL